MRPILKALLILIIGTLLLTLTNYSTQALQSANLIGPLQKPTPTPTPSPPTEEPTSNCNCN